MPKDPLATAYKSTVLCAMGTMLPRAVTFLMLPIVTPFLTPDDYGIFTSVMVVVAFFSIFASLRIEGSIQRCIYDYKSTSEKRSFVGTLMTSIIALHIVALTIATTLYTLPERIFPDLNFWPFVAIGLIHTTFMCFVTIVQTTFQITDKPWRFFTSGLTLSGLTIFGVYMGVVHYQKGVLGMLLGPLIATVITTPLVLVLARNNYSLCWNPKYFKNAFRFGLPLIPLLLTGFLLTSLDRILLGQLSGNETLGYYGLALRVASITLLLGTTVRSALQPFVFKLALEKAPGAEQMTGKSCQSILYAFALASSAVIMFTPEAFRFFIDEKFLQAAPLVIWLVIGNLCLINADILSLGVLLKKKHHWFWVIALVCAGINILLNLAWIPQQGAMGAAKATALTAALVMIARYVLNQRTWAIDFRMPVTMTLSTLSILLAWTLANTSLPTAPSVLAKTLALIAVAALFYKVARPLSVDTPSPSPH